ncbi:MAG: cation diffusion facilitator family transporter [Eubacteriales bacterium]
MTKNVNNEINAASRAKIGRNAGIIGIGVNILLFILKLTAGILSGSVSIVADAVNNLTDAGSSILVMLGYIVSAKPADHEHPYGHARMEYICGLFISIIVTVLGIELFKSSVESIFDGGEAATYSAISVIIMVCAVGAKIGLALFYKLTAKKIDSETLSASAADSIGDVCATGAVILGIILTPYFGKATDGVFGAAVAIYIFVMGVKLIIESSNTLLGKAPDTDLIKKIVGKLNSYDGVIGIHDLVIHNYGVDNYFVSVHVEMDADRDIMESHDIIDNIEVDFKEQMGIQLVIHLDPVTLHDDRVNELHLKIHEIVGEIASEFSSPMALHDFRVVFGVTHTNIIFDIAVTHEIPLTNDEIVNMIREKVTKTLGQEYKVVLTIDRDYTTTRY